jgi:hypothetical protein
MASLTAVQGRLGANNAEFAMRKRREDSAGSCSISVTALLWILQQGQCAREHERERLEPRGDAKRRRERSGGLVLAALGIFRTEPELFENVVR